MIKVKCKCGVWIDLHDGDYKRCSQCGEPYLLTPARLEYGQWLLVIYGEPEGG